MFGRRHEPEYIKSVFERTQILRKPISGIVAGYHILPYILVGPQEDQAHRSVEIRGKIRVSPRLIISPGRQGQTYGEVFDDPELMDRALMGRVFSFLYAGRQDLHLENEELVILKRALDPQEQIGRALDELQRQENLETGLILSPDVRFYPISIDRFIREILDREFGVT